MVVKKRIKVIGVMAPSNAPPMTTVHPSAAAEDMVLLLLNLSAPTTTKDAWLGKAVVL